MNNKVEKREHCHSCIIPLGMSFPASYTCWDTCPCHKPVEKREVSVCCGAALEYRHRDGIFDGTVDGFFCSKCHKLFEPVVEANYLKVLTNTCCAKCGMAEMHNRKHECEVVEKCENFIKCTKAEKKYNLACKHCSPKPDNEYTLPKICTIHNLPMEECLKKNGHSFEIPTPDNGEAWEDEFENRFYFPKGKEWTLVDIKSFIKSLLSSEREKIIGRIKTETKLDQSITGIGLLNIFKGEEKDNG